MTGKIKTVMERGFGFIMSEDGREFFFHRSALTNQYDWDDFKPGKQVTFEPTIGEKGPRAERVSLVLG